MKIFPTFCLFFFSLSITSSQTHNWSRTNPGGGGAFSTIGAGPTGIIIAGSDLSGAYRSTDHGQSWDVIGASKGMTETHISGVGFDRLNGEILYLGTENGIFRSTNGGNSVEQVLTGGYITDIEFGTNNPSTGYASYHPTYNSNQGVIYKSNDQGVSWSQISSNLSSNLRILKIIVNPSDADKLYILTGEGRFACGPAEVFRSFDGGVNWENLTTSLPEILDFAIDPNNPETVLLSTMNADCNELWYWADLIGNLYKSTDGGTNWGNPISSNTGIIWIDNTNSTNIHLIDPREPYSWNDLSGTYSSTDGGISFTQSGNVDNWDVFFNDDTFYCYSSSFNGIAKTLGEDLSDPSKYYWVNSQWVFETDDYGSSFHNIFTDEISDNNWISRGFDNVNMMDISIHETNPNLVYSAYFDIGIWKSSDKGESWQSCNPVSFSGNWEGYGGNCASVLTDPTRENMVWATMSENQNGENPTYLLRSTEYGDPTSWEQITSGLPLENIMGLSVDRNSTTDNRVLFLTANGDVYKSDNDGLNWQSKLDNDGCYFTAIDNLDSDLIYAGGNQGLWRSQDGGENWTDISHSEMIGNYNFWHYNYTGVFDIQTDPNNTNIVYVTAFGNGKGLFKSTDAGSSWTKILEDDYLRKVKIAPQNSSIIYATSSSAFEAGGYSENSNGIWYSTDGGITWGQENQGMDYPFALAIDIDNSSSPTVFVGSPGTGFQKSSNGDIVSVTEYGIQSSITIIPNPTNNQFEIRSDHEYLQIKMYDVFGRLVMSLYKNNDKNPVQVKELNTGAYVISLINLQGEEVGRNIFIKK